MRQAEKLALAICLGAKRRALIESLAVAVGRPLVRDDVALLVRGAAARCVARRQRPSRAGHKRAGLVGDARASRAMLRRRW